MPSGLSRSCERHVRGWSLCAGRGLSSNRSCSSSRCCWASQSNGWERSGCGLHAGSGKRATSEHEGHEDCWSGLRLKIYMV